MRNYLAILLTVVCCGMAIAQRPFTRDYWLNESGTDMKVNTIKQDPNGYLWLGADDGLYKYNGRAIVPVQGAIHKAVTAIALQGADVIVGHKDGSLAILTHDTLMPYPLRGMPPANSISDMYVDERGILWLCTEGQGFFMVFNSVAVACNTTNGLSDNFVYNLTMMPGRRILVSTDQGMNMVHIENKKLYVNAITTDNGLPDNIVRVVKHVPNTSLYWAGTQSGGVAIYNGSTGKVHVPQLDTPWHWGQVNDILPISSNKTWVATEDGYLLLLTGDVTDMHVQVFALQDKKINKLSIGKSGALWCATNAGLTLVTDEYLKYLPISSPYKLDQVNAMTCTADGSIWFSLDNKLYTVPSRGSNFKPTLRYTATAGIKSLFADKNNNLWIGTLGKGLFRMDAKGKTSAVQNIPQLQNETVLDISGQGDELWVSGLNGVEELQLTDNQLQLIKIYNKRNGAGSDYVYQVYHDNKGRKWLATDGGGITMYSNGAFKQFTAADGLPGNVVYTLTEDAYGTIWASALDAGICWFDGTRWHKLSQQYGINDVNVATLAANTSGQVIAVHKKGLDIWYPQSKQFRSYSRRQGIHIDSVSEILKLYAKDTRGNVYIPFEQGFVMIKNSSAKYDIRPDIHIQSLSVFFKEEGLNTYQFNHNQNHISFKYEGISFANPDKLYYRYKLEGYSNSWVVTNDESVTYPQLLPGNYTFRVQSSVNTAFINANEDICRFSISLPVWREKWFITLVIFAILGLVYYITNRREKNLRKFTSLQKERMMFEYEHLKSQVNPHFLFNSLNTLASLIEEDKNIASDYTTHLSDLYRNMLAHRNEDLITLEQEWEILNNYIYIQNSRFGDALIVETQVPDYIMQNKKIVPLALQLIVENAIKHNVVSKSRPLHISIIADEESITIRNSLNPKISKEKGAGLGMVNIKNRYNLLTKKSIYYGISDKEYVVNLPLL